MQLEMKIRIRSYLEEDLYFSYIMEWSRSNSPLKIIEMFDRMAFNDCK